ncbi:MAG: hypothetical protein AB8B64_05645 [Granulosicoccus sp.]
MSSCLLITDSSCVPDSFKPTLLSAFVTVFFRVPVAETDVMAGCESASEMLTKRASRVSSPGSTPALASFIALFADKSSAEFGESVAADVAGVDCVQM